jgi:tRNA(Ile)-lysidine synthase
VLEQLAKNIRQRKLFRDGERIVIAVSGGVDSMTLLHALHRLAPEHRWQLAIAHLNHKLRGRDSDADERLVRRIANDLELPIVIDRANVKAHATKTGQSIEMAARELRHHFLVRCAKKLRIKTVTLAHHADDQVELFLIRLLRGASPEGLAGMKWRSPSPEDKSVQLVRPLLNLTREQLEAFARKNQIRWREDKTNLCLDFLRNRVRRELIPVLENEYQPALRKTILRLTELLAAESDFVAESAAKARGRFDSLPVAIQRRRLQRRLFELGVTADFETIEQLRLNAGKVIQVSPVLQLMRDERGYVRPVSKQTFNFSKQRLKVALSKKKQTINFGDRVLNVQVLPKRGDRFIREPNTESFDADKVGRLIQFRHWQPGDRFQPIGATSSRKLQDMFVDLKIAKHERHWRVIATTAAGEIFWVEGLRISERFKLSAATKRRLTIWW